MADTNNEVQPQKYKNIRCSFCGTKSEKAFRLIAGPKKNFICDECVKFCMEILREEGAFWCPISIPNRKSSFELTCPRLYKPEQQAGEYVNDILFVSPQNVLSKKLFTSHLKPFAKKHNLKIKNITNTKKEMERVDGELLEIHNASLILVDITSQSPYVMYLLGMINLIGKPYLILMQDKTEIPRFCFSGRVYSYEKDGKIIPDFNNELNEPVIKIV